MSVGGGEGRLERVPPPNPSPPEIPSRVEGHQSRYLRNPKGKMLREADEVLWLEVPRWVRKNRRTRPCEFIGCRTHVFTEKNLCRRGHVPLWDRPKSASNLRFEMVLKPFEAD